MLTGVKMMRGHCTDWMNELDAIDAHADEDRAASASEDREHVLALGRRLGLGLDVTVKAA